MTLLLQCARTLFLMCIVLFYTAITHSGYSQNSHLQTGVNVPVDLELVLAVDVSNSMDSEERVLQRQGYEAAFRHQDVLTAIQGGFLGRIAVTYVEWADPGRQNIAVPWMVIHNKETAEAFADKLAQARLVRMRRTSIGDALLFAASLFEENSYKGLRHVIDVSGDGPNNEGGEVTKARDAVLARGIIINGLPILIKKEYSQEQLDIYYEDCVIGGPGAFIITIKKRSEFVKAIRKKIILEIASARPKIWHAQLRYQRPSRVSCAKR